MEIIVTPEAGGLAPPPRLFVASSPTCEAAAAPTPGTGPSLWLDMNATTPQGPGAVPAHLPFASSPAAGAAAVMEAMAHFGGSGGSSKCPPLHRSAPVMTPLSLPGSVTEQPQQPRLLGRGGFGAVFAISDRVAQKRIPLTFTDAGDRGAATELAVAQRIVRLWQQHQSSTHPSLSALVRVFGVHVGQTEATIDMELLDAGPLSRYAPITDEACLAGVARQLLLGLQELHTHVGALHRDIKPQNILASRDGAIKLIDFGCAALATEPGDAGALLASDQQGSTIQMAPERLRGEPHGPASDVWSVGVTIAELATGKHPFMSAAAADLAGDGGVTGRFWALASVIKHTASADECAAATDAALTQALANSSDVLRDFVRRAVHADPVRRATIAGLLEHPFVARGESDRSNGGGGSHTVPGPWVA